MVCVKKTKPVFLGRFSLCNYFHGTFSHVLLSVVLVTVIARFICIINLNKQNIKDKNNVVLVKNIKFNRLILSFLLNLILY